MKKLHKYKLILIGVMSIVIWSFGGNGLFVKSETIGSQGNAIEESTTIESQVNEDNTTLSDSEDSVQEQTKFIEENIISDSSVGEARHSFSPPSELGGGWYFFHDETNDDNARRAVRERGLPWLMSGKIEVNDSLGGNINDYIEINISGRNEAHVRFPLVQNAPYIQGESWYGFLTLDNLLASSNSSSITVDVIKKSDGIYSLKITRVKKDKATSFDISVSYNYSYPYYRSVYGWNAVAGTKWTKWADAGTMSVQNRSSNIKINAIPSKDEELSAKVVPQTIDLGSPPGYILDRGVVEDVKFGNKVLQKNEYTLELLEEPDMITVGKKRAQVKITYKANELIVDVPIQVDWGNTVHLKGESYKSIMALAIGPGANPNLVASRGVNDGDYKIHSRYDDYLEISIFNPASYSNPRKVFKIKGTDLTTNVYQKVGREKFEMDSVLKISNKEIMEYPELIDLYTDSGVETPNKNKFMTNNDLYLRNNRGKFEILKFNHLIAKKGEVSIDSTEKYLDEHINDYIDTRGFDGVSVRFEKYPDTSSVGTKKGIITGRELINGTAIEKDYEIAFDVIDDRLTVETKGRDIYLGTNSNIISPNTFIKSVKLGDQELGKNDYKVEYVTNIDTSIIGKSQFNLKITLKSDESKFINVDSEATIKYGSTIISRANSTGDVDTSVSLLDKEGTPYLNANQGFGFSKYGGLLSRPVLTIHRDKSSNRILYLSYGTIRNTPKKLAEIWNQSFNNVDIEYGDVVKYSVNSYGSASTNLKGKNTWISRNESLVIETQGYDEAYYELTKDGYRLMNINQLIVNNSNKISLNTSQEEINENVMNFISIPSHISNPKDYRLEFESVDSSSSGEKTSRIKVYQKLQSGGEFMTTYQVNYTVNPEVEETYYDIDGNKILETKKTAFDYGTQFTPSPDKYIEKEGDLYVYKGWLGENENPVTDTPREGIPHPVRTESKLNYVYDKADKYINVTIPTEIVFGTYDNKEKVTSKEYELKNNSNEFTTKITLETFGKVKSDVKLLGEEESEPSSKEKSAKLNLLVNGELLIKGLNESIVNREITNLTPNSVVNLSIDGNYFGDETEKNIVEYNTKLKFKSIEGNKKEE
ncbi:TPA: hypothetical protein K8G88_000594 [Listeria monocytogenes]|nr:hypothetical protein [Listeria monocytogenes]HBI6388921.1 hypothetical protein [Listeria monocytogenes]HBI6654151.1 hypothetical protein [Listeria monocytogenes]